MLKHHDLEYPFPDARWLGLALYGRTADSSMPFLINGDEITIRAYWSGSPNYGALSARTYIDDQED
jgi:hypothetical protein